MDPLFKEFLISRGIEETLINIIEEEKIDVEAVLSMGHSALQHFIPKIGDCHAVIAFCNRVKHGECSGRDSLVNKLKEKLDCYSTGQKVKKSEKGKCTNKHFKKTTRRVYLGWIHNNVQVRAVFGGGTRLIDVARTDKKIDILEKAKNLFFVNGNSSKGQLSEMEIDLVDYERKTFSNDITVQRMFEVTELSNLRFYLLTKKGESEAQFEDYVEVCISEPELMPEVVKPCQTSPPDLTEYNAENISIEVETDPLNFDTTLSQYLSYDSIFYPDINNMGCNNLNLVVHRGHIYEELLQKFVSVSCEVSLVTVEVVAPNGVKETALDTGGVLRDVLTEFWSTFYMKHCAGTSAKVPVVSHQYNAQTWQIIAKILYVGYMQVKYFPKKLAKPFMHYAISKRCDQKLTETYFDFISSYDAGILRRALNEFDEVDEEELMDVLEAIQCKKLVNQGNIQLILKELAHTEFIQKPKYILDVWHTVLKMLPISESTLKDIYEKNKITNKNVLNLINYSLDEMVSIQNQEKVKLFLKQFLREADLNILERFLRFCTGSDIIIEDNIQVTFNNVTGICRTPIGHTCSSTLELSVDYETYFEFKEELTKVLISDFWSMDIL